MTNQSRPTTKLVLSDAPGLGRIDVDMEAFFEFSFMLAESLEDLVARWARRSGPLAIELQRKRKSLPR